MDCFRLLLVCLALAAAAPVSPILRGPGIVDATYPQWCGLFAAQPTAAGEAAFNGNKKIIVEHNARELTGHETFTMGLNQVPPPPPPPPPPPRACDPHTAAMDPCQHL